MSLIFSNFQPIKLPECAELQPKRVYAKHFDVEEMYSLVDEYTDRVDGIAEADLTINKKNFATLTILERNSSSVKVYHTELTDEVFAIMDQAYSEAIEGSSSHADDYWDRWEAMQTGLRPTIVDMEFFSDAIPESELLMMAGYED